jgi:Tol biopolymer transport system component
MPRILWNEREAAGFVSLVVTLGLVVLGAGACSTTPSAANPASPYSGLIVGTEPYIYAVTESTHIFTMNPDGTSKRILTDDKANRTPTWSCDGRQIVYVSSGQAWLMNADGSNKKQLTFLPTGAASPSLSCDGKLSFVSQSQKTGTAAIFVMEALSSAPHQITSDDTFNYASSISPDGKKVVFTRQLNNDEHREIFVVDADGSNERQLTFATTDLNAPDANAPAWSPDSKRIAFFQGFEDKGNGAERTTPDIRYLAVMNADGSNRHWLTDCSGGASSAPGQCADDPSWSSDGTWIIYSSTSLSTWIIKSDGSTAPSRFLDFLLLFGNGGKRTWKN